MKKTFFLLIAAITIISACSSPKPDSKADLSLADQLLDEQLYSEAIGVKDAEKCTKIAAKDLQKECADVVDAIKITKKAVSDDDQNACEKIELKRYRENCENSVSTAIEAKEAYAKLAETDRKLEDQIQSAEAKAIDSGDPDLCNSIEDENQKYSCKYNVVVNKAVSAKNPELCEVIGKEPVILECKNAVGNN
ncbi:hypothetical protein HY604_04175 [Candidatus Peregrinibacteria bacterium]|nr:hypothetical protein [Candidatus Peregrinibacteria bacterium]